MLTRENRNSSRRGLVFCAFAFLFGMLLVPAGLSATTWGSDLNAAFDEAKRTGKPVLLDIYAPWCGYCRKLQKEVYPSTEVRELVGDFVPVRLDGEQHRNLMMRYRVRGYPTIIVFDANGTEVDRIDGYMPKRVFARRLRDIHRRSQRENELLDKLKGDPESVLLNFETGVYYYESGDAASARRYFLRAYRGNAGNNVERGKRRDALYNSAVASMDLKDYAAALKYWDEFLKKYDEQRDTDYAYARFYRGVSLKAAGRGDEARADLQYAAAHLPESRSRRHAADMLSELR